MLRKIQIDEPTRKFVGDIDQIAVTLNMFGDDLDPDEITRLLGVQPTRAARKGDQVRLGPDTAVVTQWTGVWYLSIERTSEYQLSEAIGMLLDRLPDDPQLWFDLNKQYNMSLFCGLFLNQYSRESVLPPELLARVSARHLALSFDIYFEAAEDIVEPALGP
jgi:uncharacterized protein DUF4279